MDVEIEFLNCLRIAQVKFFRCSRIISFGEDVLAASKKRIKTVIKPRCDVSTTFFGASICNGAYEL